MSRCLWGRLEPKTWVEKNRLANLCKSLRNYAGQNMERQETCGNRLIYLRWHGCHISITLWRNLVVLSQLVSLILHNISWFHNNHTAIIAKHQINSNHGRSQRCQRQSERRESALSLFTSILPSEVKIASALLASEGGAVTMWVVQLYYIYESFYFYMFQWFTLIPIRSFYMFLSSSLFHLTYLHLREPKAAKVLLWNHGISWAANTSNFESACRPYVANLRFDQNRRTSR